MDDGLAERDRQLARIETEIKEARELGRIRTGCGVLLFIVGSALLGSYEWRLGLGAALLSLGAMLHNDGYSQKMLAYVMQQDTRLLNAFHMEFHHLRASLPGIIQQYAPASVAAMFARNQGVRS